MRRGISSTAIVILLVITIPVAYFGIVYYSINSAELSIANPTLDFGITDLLSLDSLLNVFASGQIEGEFDLVIEGHGLVSTTIKSYQAKIYLEDIDIGEIQSDQVYTIPASGTTTAHMNFLIDISDLSLNDLTSVATSIMAHNGEVEMSIIGYYEPILLVFPITLEFSSTSYTYTYSDSPSVTQLTWVDNECEVGETVDFQVSVKNVFRGADVNGYLDLYVREDVQYGADFVADSFRYPVSLSPGQSESFNGDFISYKDSETRGFFLKAEWGSSTIAEQSSSYPPRLSVLEGQLNVKNVYWEVDGATTSTCTVGDDVQAHIILEASQASVQGSIRVKIRRDIAFFPDEDYLVRDYSVSLDRGASRDVVVTFSPDEASGVSFRGYFVEIEGEASWTMESSYPPRLSVQSSSGGEEPPEEPEEPETGYPVVQNVWWIRDGYAVSQCSQGDVITARVRIQSVSGSSTGIVTVRVREDKVLMPDSDHVVQAFSVELENNQLGDMEVTFIASEKSGFTFRGYFIEVDFDSWGNSWTMESEYPPRLTVN